MMAQTLQTRLFGVADVVLASLQRASNHMMAQTLKTRMFGVADVVLASLQRASKLQRFFSGCPRLVR